MRSRETVTYSLVFLLILSIFSGIYGPEKVLELDENATAEEVKMRYKARIKKFHPDANNGDRSYEEKLNKVIQAYNYLKASGFC